MNWYDSLLDPVLSTQGADRRLIAALESVKKAVHGLVAVAGSTADAPWLRGDSVGRLQAFARTLARFTSAMRAERATENIEGAGSEMTSCGDLPRLVRTRARIRALRGACDALAPLIRVEFLKARARTASPAVRHDAPCMVALDALSIIDTETQLAAVVKHLDRTLMALERAIRLATRQQDSRILWSRRGLRT